VTIDDNLIALVETESRSPPGDRRARLLKHAEGAEDHGSSPRCRTDPGGQRRLPRKPLNGGSLKWKSTFRRYRRGRNVVRLDPSSKVPVISMLQDRAADASARIDGSGDARLQARDRLVAKINGTVTSSITANRPACARDQR